MINTRKVARPLSFLTRSGSNRKQTREVPPSPRDGADTDDRAQVEELDDAEKDIVGECADPVFPIHPGETRIS